MSREKYQYDCALFAFCDFGCRSISKQDCASGQARGGRNHYTCQLQGCREQHPLSAQHCDDHLLLQVPPAASASPQRQYAGQPARPGHPTLAVPRPGASASTSDNCGLSVAKVAQRANRRYYSGSGRASRLTPLVPAPQAQAAPGRAGLYEYDGATSSSLTAAAGSRKRCRGAVSCCFSPVLAPART